MARAVTALDRVNDFLFPDADEKYVPEGLAYIQAATNHIRIDSNVCDGALKSDLHPAIEGDGLGGSDRARVADEVHRVAGKLPIRRLVKKRAIDQVVIIDPPAGIARLPRRPASSVCETTCCSGRVELEQLCRRSTRRPTSHRADADPAAATEQNLPHDWKEQGRFLGFAA